MRILQVFTPGAGRVNIFSSQARGQKQHWTDELIQ